MEHDSTQSNNGRFDVVFKHLHEIEVAEASPEATEASIREHEGIEELRRLSAEFAEVPQISYTTSSGPIPSQNSPALHFNRVTPAS